MKSLQGTFEIAGWDENAYAELGGGGKLTEAKVTQKFTGGLMGEGTVIWLMCYVNEKSARFVGLQRVVGAIGDRKGSLVMDTKGEFDGAVAKGRWSIIPGSGTDGFSGIEGEGRFEAPHGPKATYQIDYALAEPFVER